MPKRNQWHYDTPYRNNKKKSMVIITGNYKKRETYKKQAALHQDPGKLAQKAASVLASRRLSADRVLKPFLKIFFKMRRCWHTTLKGSSATSALNPLFFEPFCEFF